MCGSKPKTTTTPAVAPVAPPPPEATPTAPKTAAESAAADDKTSQGKRSLRINLNLSSPDSTGLSVPSA